MRTFNESGTPFLCSTKLFFFITHPASIVCAFFPVGPFARSVRFLCARTIVANYGDAVSEIDGLRCDTLEERERKRGTERERECASTNSKTVVPSSTQSLLHQLSSKLNIILNIRWWISHSRGHGFGRRCALCVFWKLRFNSMYAHWFIMWTILTGSD